MPKKHHVNQNFARKALVDKEHYDELYRDSLTNNERFWKQQAQRVDWIRQPENISDVSYDRDDVHIRWYADGILNVCSNCLDRHLDTRADKTAILWQGDEPEQHLTISYQQLYTQVCKFANGLKALGIRKGDRVMIYLPMIPDVAVAMLACARIGAVHSVVFGGFSADSLAHRIRDCQASMVITTDLAVRGSKPIALKQTVDRACELDGVMDTLEHVLIVSDKPVLNPPRVSGRDIDFDSIATTLSDECPAEPMGAEDPLFILYTSGSTGTPKGVLHTSGGYLVYAAMSHEMVFDLKEDDVFWCTADAGWITGHSYIVYGPLANGATTLMYEGVPNYPDASRFWDICDRHQVTLFYTAPTAIRALMREGDEPVKRTSRSSLRLLGTVGEPINPEAWEWYYKVVGDERCPIVDTWWQTETGGILISPLPGAHDLKPGSATLPLPGIEPALLDDDGNLLSDTVATGNLVLKRSWPGQMRTVYGDHQRFIDTYFSRFDGVYTTGDGARRDEDGYYWITGRVDDVLNVSGHRLGTAEIESALVLHPMVAEAAVVGIPHPIKGQAIYAFVTPIVDCQPDDALTQALKQQVRDEIGSIASVERLQFAASLPKTRSGKIMRRILRQIAGGHLDDLGDTSTLADPNVVKQLIEHRKEA